MNGSDCFVAFVKVWTIFVFTCLTHGVIRISTPHIAYCHGEQMENVFFAANGQMGVLHCDCW